MALITFEDLQVCSDFATGKDWEFIQSTCHKALGTVYLNRISGLRYADRTCRYGSWRCWFFLKPGSQTCCMKQVTAIGPYIGLGIQANDTLIMRVNMVGSNLIKIVLSYIDLPLHVLVLVLNLCWLLLVRCCLFRILCALFYYQKDCENYGCQDWDPCKEDYYY